MFKVFNENDIYSKIIYSSLTYMFCIIAFVYCVLLSFNLEEIIFNNSNLINFILFVIGILTIVIIKAYYELKKYKWQKKNFEYIKNEQILNHHENMKQHANTQSLTCDKILEKGG